MIAGPILLKLQIDLKILLAGLGVPRTGSADCDYLECVFFLDKTSNATAARGIILKLGCTPLGANI
jgi:hypothetical protein